MSFKIGKTSEFKECHWDVAVSLFPLDTASLTGSHKFANIASGPLMQEVATAVAQPPIKNHLALITVSLTSFY